MKALFLFVAALPLTARATTRIECESTPVNFTITSANSILNASDKFTIVGTGMRTTTENAQISERESTTEPKLVLNLITLDQQGKEDPYSSIHARLELAVAKAADGTLKLTGTGAIDITNTPAQPPRGLLNRYDLTACTGTL